MSTPSVLTGCGLRLVDPGPPSVHGILLSLTVPASGYSPLFLVFELSVGFSIDIFTMTSVAASPQLVIGAAASNTPRTSVLTANATVRILPPWPANLQLDLGKFGMNGATATRSPSSSLRPQASGLPLLAGRHLCPTGSRRKCGTSLYLNSTTTRSALFCSSTLSPNASSVSTLELP
jgi:hypothetical protein